MAAMMFQITIPTIVYSTVYSDADQRKHQNSAPLAFVQDIHRWLVNSPHKRPVTWKMFPFDDIIMDWENTFIILFQHLSGAIELECVLTHIFLDQDSSNPETDNIKTIFVSDNIWISLELQLNIVPCGMKMNDSLSHLRLMMLLIPDLLMSEDTNQHQGTAV